MRRLIFLLAAALIALPSFAADPHITPEERAKLIKYLHESGNEFLACIQNVSDARWRWQPAPEKWSVGEVAQHITIAETFLFELATKAMDSAADPDWEAKTKGKTEFLERALLNRTHKVQAPEPLQQNGITMTRDECIAKFKAARAKTIEFAETTQLPLREHITAGPFPAFVLYIPLHNLRHDQQIAEVEATPGYPAGVVSLK